MNTGSMDERQMLADIHGIKDALNRIANVAEAWWKRERENAATTLEDIERIGGAIRAVTAGFAEMKQQVKQSNQDNDP